MLLTANVSHFLASIICFRPLAQALSSCFIGFLEMSVNRRPPLVPMRWEMVLFFDRLLFNAFVIPLESGALNPVNVMIKTPVSFSPSVLEYHSCII